ncbi:MAG: AsmA family protein, partial [Robiginitomaculum sp.]|nr:AsmA family protein [Robiginitomaculum sp.]
MRKIIIGIGVILALIGIAIFVVTALIPSSVYKSTIEQQVSAKLGRNVHIGGDVSLSIFPTIRANAKDVTIANGEGFSDIPFIKMESLQAKVKLLPLLKKQVEIKEFTLISPKISLEKLKTGQVNWDFGDSPTANQTKSSSAAFKRDGRYADLQISLGVFTLKDGQITYKDAQKGVTHTVTSANIKLAMLGMDKPVTVKGNLVFNEIPLDIDSRLETPRSFLNGQKAPFTLKLKSELVTLSAEGEFTASEDLTFDIRFDTDIPSLSKLDKMLGITNPYGALSERAKLKASLVFDGTNMKAKNAVLALESAILTTNFTGDFTAGPKPTASGNLSVNINDPNKLQDTFGFNYPQLALLDSVQLSTKLTTDGVVTTGENVVFTLKGQEIDANYIGRATLNNALNLDGNFTVASPSLKSLTTKLGLKNIQGADVIGNFSVSGRVSGIVDALSLSGIDFKTEGEYITAGYIGDIKMGETILLNGSFDTFIPSIKNFTTQTGLKNPYSDALGTLQAKGEISGTAKALSLSNIDANLSDGLLNLQFTGNAQTGKALKYDGMLKTNITSLRKLLALGGTELPASTSQGEVYGPFSLSGQAKGNAKNISFTNAKLSIDEITGTGSFSADLNASKPKITGILDLNALDLRPYMAAQNPSGKIQPWKEQPLNLKALKLFDANFALNTPNILINRLKLGQSNIKAIVKNGILTTDIPNISLYGGSGDLDMTVNGNSPITKFALNFTLKDVDGKGFLGAAAGFTKLTGNTGTTMSFRGSGRSQAVIMRSL